MGRVEAFGPGAGKFRIGDRVGIGWIHSTCGTCGLCKEGDENLCEEFRATGRDANGGYAEYTTVHEEFAIKIPDIFTDAEAAPLLCAGAIGYRSLRLTGMKDGQNLGLTGFGASAHLVLKMARHKYPSSHVFVFARSEQERLFARELGAVWAGVPEQESPEKLHCIVDTTPAWRPIVEGLKNLRSGGRLIINAIRKEEMDQNTLLQLNYPASLAREGAQERGQSDPNIMGNPRWYSISSFKGRPAEGLDRPMVAALPSLKRLRAGRSKASSTRLPTSRSQDSPHRIQNFEVKRSGR